MLIQTAFLVPSPALMLSAPRQWATLCGVLRKNGAFEEMTVPDRLLWAAPEASWMGSSSLVERFNLRQPVTRRSENGSPLKL